MTWWLASILANANIAVVEYLNRTAGYENFFEALMRTSPFIFLAQMGLFYAWQGAPSFMVAWAFFTIGNMGARLVSNHYFVGEQLNWIGYVGVGTMLLAGQLIKMGTEHGN